MTHNQLLEQVMEQYCVKGSTPEEFGERLHDATMTIPEWLSSEPRRESVLRKGSARAQICKLNGGYELLQKEEKR